MTSDAYNSTAMMSMHNSSGSLKQSKQPSCAAQPCILSLQLIEIDFHGAVRVLRTGPLRASCMTNDCVKILLSYLPPPGAPSLGLGGHGDASAGPKETILKLQ